ncbi:hypothetical protein AX768_07035 [Burkholderia sp. PAMC 28687]|nr:hypothetical protein AX768_07035 [Burkholderia sp. PAMC 28687]
MRTTFKDYLMQNSYADWPNYEIAAALLETVDEEEYSTHVKKPSVEREVITELVDALFAHTHAGWSNPLRYTHL